MNMVKKIVFLRCFSDEFLRNSGHPTYFDGSVFETHIIYSLLFTIAKGVTIG